MPPKSNAVLRFLSYVDKNGPLPISRPELGNCWLWTGAKQPRGYGFFGFEGKSWSAHRWSYQTFVGPIPDGLQIDHLCVRTSCVRPSHLEAVTGRENKLRGRTLNAMNLAKTHCPQGHEYTPENTAPYRKQGVLIGRICRTCRNLGNNRYYAANRAKERARAVEYRERKRSGEV